MEKINQFPESQAVNFIFCSSCEGRGFFTQKICSSCHGYGLFLPLANKKILFFDLKNFPSIFLLKKIKKIFSFIFNLALIIFGLFGVFSLTRFILAVYQSPLCPVFGCQSDRVLIFIFWFSVLTDLFLFYRFNHTKEKEEAMSLVKEEFTPFRDLPLTGHITGHTFPVKEIAGERISWDEVLKGEKINVADFFSLEAKKSLESTFLFTKKLLQSEIEPIHLFIGCLESRSGAVLINRLGLEWSKVKEGVAKILEETKPVFQKRFFSFSAASKEILIRAWLISLKRKRSKLGVLEIILSLSYFFQPVTDLFDKLEVKPSDLDNVCLWLDLYEDIRKDWQKLFFQAGFKPKGGMNQAMTAVATPFLNNFSQDLTELAKLGYLLPILGREKEIQEIFRLLEAGLRGIVLNGPPGVGKTSIIEGLARKMIQGEVPKVLLDKRLVSLSLAKLVAGASQPGEVEERLQIILSEITRAGNVILFIKDIHNMVGIKTTEGGLDISEILSEVIERKDLVLLATSLTGTYQRYLENQALGQTLTKIEIQEPSRQETIRILEAKTPLLEAKNKVLFSYQSLVKTFDFSQRYLAEKFLPRKAIELLEETAVYVRQKKGKQSFVLAEDVAEIVSQKIGTPVTKISIEESERLIDLEKAIHQRIVNQEEAVKAVATAIRRARTGLRDIKKPIVNLLFLGPTGVGKTELAKTVAEVYFGDEKKMIRLDMSEYQEKISLARLIGSPTEPKGLLTEAVRQAPFSLLLLDEIEKSHPDILNVFLQVMEDGRLTDFTGRTIDFTNIILIGTSNAGTDFIQEELKKGKRIEEIEEILKKEKLQPYFRPEFLNRLDRMIIFKPLGMVELIEITKLLLKKLTDKLLEKGIILEVTPKMIKELARDGFDPIFGARPLKRLIQERVNDVLADYLLTGRLTRGDLVLLETGGKIRVKKIS